jgi:hypothetical protein
MSGEAGISPEEARRKVRNLLDAEEKDMAEFGSGLRSAAEQTRHEETCRLVIAHVAEYDFGWLFYYDSAAFVETGEISHALVGNAPYLVERDTGRILVTGTAYPMDHYLRLYRSGDLPLVEEKNRRG